MVRCCYLSHAIIIPVLYSTFCVWHDPCDSISPKQRNVVWSRPGLGTARNCRCPLRIRMPSSCLVRIENEFRSRTLCRLRWRARTCVIIFWPNHWQNFNGRLCLCHFTLLTLMVPTVPKVLTDQIVFVFNKRLVISPLPVPVLRAPN